MTVNFVPEGYHTVTPYLFVPNALEHVGRAMGQHVGSTGQTLRPMTTAQHQAAVRAHRIRPAEAADAASTGSPV